MNKERVQLLNELHAPARRNFPRRSVVIRGYDDLSHADLVEMRPYAKQNRGYHYILTIIDTFSKSAWTIPVKTKSGRDVTAAFTTVLRQSDRCPRNLQTEMGKEFYNAQFQRCAKMRGINHYSTYSVMKKPHVETILLERVLSLGRAVTCAHTHLKSSQASDDQRPTR